MDIIENYFGGVRGIKTVAAKKETQLAAPAEIMNIVRFLKK